MGRSQRAKLLTGSASNLLRLVVSIGASLFLPHFLVHRMPVAEYSAWVLILQLSNYVTFLDLGTQTAIGKFVAQYDAQGDREQARRMLSTAVSLLCFAALAGVIAVLFLALQLPHLFAGMPQSLWSPARIGLLAVGLSIALSLPLSAFGSVFVGLQEYVFPTILAVISRTLSTIALVCVLLYDRSLAVMSLVLGAFNVLTNLAGFAGWRHYAKERVPFTFFFLDRRKAKELAEYCGVLGLWTLGTLLISGLDTTLVGHYDFARTGAYAVAASATNFMLVLISSLLSPLMPAASSMGTQRTAEQMGKLLLRATRYSVLLLFALALPLEVFGHTLLRLWVGAAYAQQGILFLRVLVLANVVRYLVYIYSVMVIAAGKQRYATVSPVVEAITNLVASVLLAPRMGAIGVALGTLIGSFAGITLHFIISMPATQAVLRFRRRDLLWKSIARPALVLLPTLALASFWIPLPSGLLPMSWLPIVSWLVATGAIAWLLGLDAQERDSLLRQAQGRLGLRVS